MFLHVFSDLLGKELCDSCIVFFIALILFIHFVQDCMTNYFVPNMA